MIAEEKQKKTHFNLVFLIATTIHLVWGLLIFRSAGAMLTTPVYALGLMVNNHTVLGLSLIAISLMAIVGYTQKSDSQIKYIILIIPQQISLLISAFGVIFMIINQHYADGIPRNIDFMITDQIPIIIIAAGHSIAIFKTQGNWLIDKVISFWKRI